MRGGLERWKRGVDSHGVRTAIAYALKGECDASPHSLSGVDALAAYSEAGGGSVSRFTARSGAVTPDRLTRDQLTAWVDGVDPMTGERRGRALSSPTADLLLDGTINAPKSFSLVALLHPELAVAFEALQDRLRDRVIRLWQAELNARRGAGGRIREAISRLEVVELQHRRSRALDPHLHRHLWLSVKVQGEDGKWSNVDSRVAMRMHTLVNAEGELAARTDPAWLAALARHGFSVNEEGEVAEVAHAVRAFSHRSNQIEANRAALAARWRDENPGREPSHTDLQHIDRVAWATHRPAKPSSLDEDDWRSSVLDEVADIDPDLVCPRAPHRLPDEVTPLDHESLASRAICDADDRSVSNSGRFSLLDIRAGATRAVANAGVIATREELQSVIDDVIRRALDQVVDLVDSDDGRPQHVKGFMATGTARVKRELAALSGELSKPGRSLSVSDVRRLAARTGQSRTLDRGQEEAVATIAGTDRLVTVIGPAGAGKTTILRIVKRGLDLQQRRLIVVAPTRKAAIVAEREVGAEASSLHALLADHGWRWTSDNAGAERWIQLAPGKVGDDGRPYEGPRRYQLVSGDRIVVDEAGMADLHAARALAIIAAQTGAGIAMMGDDLQAAPVGHSGAMRLMARYSSATVELSNVHRFSDPDYAALTLRLREPATREQALAVAAELVAGGHVIDVADALEAQKTMVDAYWDARERHQSIALVTATNEEAGAINRSIQDRLIAEAALTLNRIGMGRDEQRILEGDVVQTRRNDRAADVSNRARWVVAHIASDHIELTSTRNPSERRTVSADYAADHVQLAYASTVHGVQGETTDAAVVGLGVDAAGLYVGMTRGRHHNHVIIHRSRTATTRGLLADMMTRGIPELTMDDANAGARADLLRAAQRAGSADAPSQASAARSL